MYSIIADRVMIVAGAGKIHSGGFFVDDACRCIIGCFDTGGTYLP